MTVLGWILIFFALVSLIGYFKQPKKKFGPLFLIIFMFVFGCGMTGGEEEQAEETVATSEETPNAEAEKTEPAKTEAEPAAAPATEEEPLSEEEAALQAAAEEAGAKLAEGLLDAIFGEESNQPAVTEQELVAEQGLGMRPQEFKLQFNNFSRTYQLGLQIGEWDIEAGADLDMVKFMFNDNVGMMGSVNRTSGHVFDMMILANGDKTSFEQSMKALAAMIYVTNPKIPDSERNAMLEELTIGVQSLAVGQTKEIERNGVLYSTVKSDGSMWMFGAGNAKVGQ